jgi:acyl carrier protein
MGDLHLEIKRLIVESLNLEDLAPEAIDADAPLFGNEGLGLDSIDALELGVALRRKYRIVLEADDPNIKSYFQSVSSLAQLLRERGSAERNG